MNLVAEKLRVLIVDDSAMARKVLHMGLEQDPEIAVVGAASRPSDARDMIAALRPDVVTLDIEMPELDGISFLRSLPPALRVPTLVISAHGARGSRMAVEALEAGAFDVVEKPAGSLFLGLGQVMASVRDRVKLARKLRQVARHPAAVSPSPTVPARHPVGDPDDWLFALGASTGGVQALTQVVPHLPPNAPGLLIVQHMPASFTPSFAARLNELSRITVREARDGDVVEPGLALLAPGGPHHMQAERVGPGRYRVRLTQGAPVHHSRPSVDVLFASAAKVAGDKCTAAVLTGMGRDGAQGLAEIRAAGGRGLAQDEASSVVWGMPGAAHRLGAAEALVPLPDIAARMLDTVGLSPAQTQELTR